MCPSYLFFANLFEPSFLPFFFFGCCFASLSSISGREKRVLGLSLEMSRKPIVNPSTDYLSFQGNVCHILTKLWFS